LAAFDDGVNQPLIVALLKHILGLISADLAILSRSLLDEYALRSPHHDFGSLGCVTVFEDLAASAWT